MRFLIQHSNTLYGKVTIPLALHLARDGHEVSFLRHRDRFHRFSDDYIRSHPTSVAIVDRKSLAFVAELIGFGDEWRAAEPSFAFPLRADPRRFDVVVGTTKDLGALRAVNRTPAFAVGYQHLPVLVRVGGPLPRSRASALLERNAFTDSHGFAQILGDDGVDVCGFTYLDRVHERLEPRTERDQALIFHPGGYRGVVTDPGDSEDVCRAKQLAFFERACLPLLDAGLQPVIKVHPLRARFHDLPDLEGVVADLSARHGLAQGAIALLGPQDWYWDAAARSAIILNYGSSSLYELWSAGLRTAVVCNFEGTARSSKFDVLDSISLQRQEDLPALLRAPDALPVPLGPLAEQIFTAYHELFDGRATERAATLIVESIA